MGLTKTDNKITTGKLRKDYREFNNKTNNRTHGEENQMRWSDHRAKNNSKLDMTRLIQRRSRGSPRKNKADIIKKALKNHENFNTFDYLFIYT